MGRHNRSEEAFSDFIPNENFFMFNMKGGGSRAPSEPPLDQPLTDSLTASYSLGPTRRLFCFTGINGAK